jgi:hypothetical protein
MAMVLCCCVTAHAKNVLVQHVVKKSHCHGSSASLPLKKSSACDCCSSSLVQADHSSTGFRLDYPQVLMDVDLGQYVRAFLPKEAFRLVSIHDDYPFLRQKIFLRDHCLRL